ncbi:MAG: hypothetical protein WB760_13515 [Xanthobacteraceae bacterium]
MGDQIKRRLHYYRDERQRPVCTEVEPFAEFARLRCGVPYLALHRRRVGRVDIDWGEGSLFDHLRFSAVLDFAGLDAALALIWRQYGLGKSRGACVVYASGGVAGFICGVPPAAGEAVRAAVRKIFHDALETMAEAAL